VICVLAGTWADRKFGIAPWGTIVGSLFGITGSMYTVIREVGR
jgi:F0F1-type ATP synthase assembly protein I